MRLIIFLFLFHSQARLVEENDLRIPISAKNTSDITQEQFDDLMSKLEKIYTPLAAKEDGTLQLVANWKDDHVNAYARRLGTTMMVAIYGGLARHPDITLDALALIVCHELGHHFGGSPKTTFYSSVDWSSNEGQADYYGTSKCLRYVFRNDDNETLISQRKVPRLVSRKCGKSFSSRANIALCERNAMAGLSLATFFKSIKKESVTPRFDVTDPKIVTMTYDGHPKTQCRMDTYFQGSLCSVSEDIFPDNTDPKVGACNRIDQFTLGIRPLCWFKPNS